MIHHTPDWNGEAEAEDPPVSDLLIRRFALYSPTKAPRSDRNAVKIRSPEVTNSDATSDEVWVIQQDPPQEPVHSPSVANMVSALPTEE
jgi:hypothetical protein